MYASKPSTKAESAKIMGVWSVVVGFVGGSGLGSGTGSVSVDVEFM